MTKEKPTVMKKEELKTHNEMIMRKQNKINTTPRSMKCLGI